MDAFTGSSSRGPRRTSRRNILDSITGSQPARRDPHAALRRLHDRLAPERAQLPVGNGHDHLGDPTIADAVLDRVVHNAHRITLKGPTRRKNDETKS